MRWVVVLGLVAACGDEESKAPAPPEPVARNTAPVRELDAAVRPTDAAPAADAPVEVGVMTSRDGYDLITSRELLPDLSKFSGLKRERDAGADPEGVPSKVMLEGSEGEFAGLSREEVDRVVKSRKGVIRACYQREIQDVPDLAGKLVIAFTIDAAGKVTQASVDADRSTLHNADVASCVTRQIIKLRFPAKGGAIVKYPFIFSPS